jgi:hypothetical protein
VTSTAENAPTHFQPLIPGSACFSRITSNACRIHFVLHPVGGQLLPEPRKKANEVMPRSHIHKGESARALVKAPRRVKNCRLRRHFA